MPRGRKIRAGDRVRCRLFNSAEGKSYGPYWNGTVHMIIQIDYETRDYMVKKDNTETMVTLHRREIKKVLTERR